MERFSFLIANMMLAFVFVLAVPTHAQTLTTPLQTNAEAELVFVQAIQAYEASDYGMAYRRFRLVMNDYPLHRKTTAAFLMAGKALYANGEFQRAADFLNDFLDNFPASRYVSEATRTRDLAVAASDQSLQTDRTIHLGIALPLGGNNGRFTQALFTGIRIAVEEHNQQYGADRLVQMHFEDTRGRSTAATLAIGNLTESGADVILGPLFSDEARAAAAAAESARIPLIAPLATDAEVSEGRRYVFQANPTMEMRGRQMARFAALSLGLDNLAVIAELGDSFGEQMAEGFQDETARLGVNLAFFRLLPNSSAWYRLTNYFTADSLRGVDAVYMPITGGQADATINAALSGLGQLKPGVRVLANKTWHDLPIGARASEHTATYTNDYFLTEDSQLTNFLTRYTELTGNNLRDRRYADEARLVYMGYDLTKFVLQELRARPGAPVDEILRNAPTYFGLASRLDFAGGNVNRALFYHRYRDGQLALIR